MIYMYIYLYIQSAGMFPAKQKGCKMIIRKKLHINYKVFWGDDIGEERAKIPLEKDENPIDKIRKFLDAQHNLYTIKYGSSFLRLEFIEAIYSKTETDIIKQI